jgi:hypothetical protein
MMTIVTTIYLKSGTASEWDAAMRERLSAARSQAGWISAASSLAACHQSAAARTRAV